TVHWSDEFFRLYDLDPKTDTPSIEAIIAALHPDDRDKMREIVKRNRAGENMAPFEFRVLHKDGSISWHNRTAEIVRDESGAPRTLIAVAQDITERKRADEELHRSREHLARVQRVAQIGSLEVDIQSGEVTWSDEVYRLLDLDPATTIPSLVAALDRVHPADRQTALEANLKGRRGEDSAPFEFRILRPDGSIRWIARHAQVIRDSNGAPRTLLATNYDITERKRADEDLRRSREHLARVQRLALIASTEVNIATQEAMWSDEVYRLLGVDRSTKPSLQAFVDHTHPEDREKLRDASTRGRHGEEIGPMEYRIVRDGEIRWVARHAHIERDPSGAPLSLIVANYDITDQKLREDELRRGREHLMRIQSIAGIGSVEVHLPTQTATWSDEEFRLMGVAPMVNPPLDAYLARVHPDDLDLVREVSLSGRRGEDVEPCEYRVRREDGSYRWVLRNAYIERDDMGAGLRMLVTNYDITERKELELSLRVNQENLALAQKVARIGYAWVDGTTHAIEWSDELYAIFGLDRATTPSLIENFYALVHPADRDMVRGRAEYVIAGDQVGPVEYRIVRPNGELRWIYSQSNVIRDAGGKRIKSLSTMLDITERKLREEELRKSREHLVRVQKIARIGSVEIDLATQTDFWSDEIRELLGVDRSVKGDLEAFLQHVHPDDHAKMREASERGRLGEAVEPIEFRVIKPDGEIRWLMRDAAVSYAPDGTPASVIITNYDITERKLREDELRRSREHLVRVQGIAGIGSLEIDLTTQVATWSEEAFSLIGVTPMANPPVDAFLAYVHPEDRERMLDISLRGRRGEDVEPCEYRVLHGNGEIRWVLRNAYIERDTHGSPLRLVVTNYNITALKRMEESLRLNQENLELAQKVAHVGFAWVDEITGKVEWSEELYSIFGLDPKTTPSDADTYYALLHPADRDKVLHRSSFVMSGRDTGPAEYRIIRPSGEVRWIYSQTTVIRDANGKRVKSLSTMLDVTDRKRMEESLRTSKDDLTFAQRVGHIGSAVNDLKAGTEEWSDEAYAILGLDPATTVASSPTYIARLHPDDREAALQQTARSFKGAPGSPSERRVIRPNGEVRWIYIQTNIVERDENGVGTKIITTLQDITDRKHMEESLRTSKDHLALAQQFGHIGSAVLDLKTGTIEWSDEAFAILGLDPATSTPSAATYVSCLHPDDREAALLQTARAHQGLPGGAAERRIVRPNGEIRWMLIQTNVVEDDHGVATKMITTLQDITDRKRAQEERDEFERQLMQSQKMEAIGKLAGGVAHDFNNLLTVITGRLDMLGEQLADRPELAAWVQTCLRAANRGASLTRSMLAFSRQQPLKPMQIDVATSIHDMIELLPRTLGEAIGVKVELAPDLWRCEADPAQLQNALLNLAINARDAMPDGGKLTIEANNARLDDDYTTRNAGVTPGDYVALSVSDTGTGMAPEVLAHAFDPFFTTKEVGKGSGLGLSMVYGFAKQSGGHANIYSEVGHGTMVRIYLPRSMAASTTPAAAPARPKTVLRRRATILVVEDDDDVRALTEAQLARLGYDSFSAMDGDEGLRVLKGHPEIALLLSDLTLPGGMSGRIVADRALEIRPDLKVLFMSGYTENAIIHHGRLDPGVHLLQKPFTIEQLADEIEAAMQ
ncbi:MAG TPA: PAS domain-containing protein, partial [Magnetospirillaceae bacterium]